MQSMARKNEWTLDQMALQCDVTKKNREEFQSPPREGAYIHGLFMEDKKTVLANGKKAYSQVGNPSRDREEGLPFIEKDSVSMTGQNKQDNHPYDIQLQ
ncbi:hypothetical protein STEG23_037260 [Scotinomys teguina]